MNAQFSDLVGKTIEYVKGGERGSERIEFGTSCNRRYLLWHRPDCCEGLEVDDVNGDWDDMIGTPILVAEERSSHYNFGTLSPGSEPIDEALLKQNSESDTWTFYVLRTIKGSVTIRWHGSSNGYYSEVASFDVESVR